MKVQADRTLVRAEGHSRRYVLVSFTAPETQRASAREPVNISFVIDRSGSMGGSKIRLAREAVVHALRMLKSTDRFSVVCYDHEVDVVVPSTLASGEAIRNAVSQVEGLQARGNTDLGAGWLKGCEEIAQHLRDGDVARCLLVSDGLANHGITDGTALAEHAEQLQARGITTSTIGLGADFDERMLEGMARAGAGAFYYVETAVQIADCLTSELGEALEVVARDVAVSVRTGDGVAVTTLNRFPIGQEADGRTALRLGDLTSRQDVDLVFRLTFPTGAVGATARAMFSVTDAGGVLREADTDIIWTYAGHQANDAQPRNVVVDRAVAALYAANAAAEALELNRAGQFERAAERLKATARRIAQYAGDDAELKAVIESLRQRDVVYAARMTSATAKLEHFASISAARMRAPDGKARRSPTSSK